MALADLLVAQGDHRIDFSRAGGWNKARNRGADAQDHRGRAKNEPRDGGARYCPLATAGLRPGNYCFTGPLTMSPTFTGCVPL